MDRTVHCAACAAPQEISGEPGEDVPCPGCGAVLRVPTGYDVFISHSSVDAAAARELCRALEARSISCWIAPRDLLPGETWADGIIKAIAQARVMVLLISRVSMDSVQVLREVERAVGRRVTLIPVLLERVPLSGAMEFFLSACHWLDAVEPPRERHYLAITRRVEDLLARAPVSGEAPPQEPELSRPEVAPGGVNPNVSPYQGPQPFRAGLGELFFGRGEECRQVVEAIARNRVVLLYAPSGAGKSSLLNTVVRDRLTRQHREVILGVRVVNAPPQGMRAADIRNIYTFSAICGLEPNASASAYEGYRQLHLADYLAARPRAFDSTGRVLVLDQFEELFTAHPERYEDRRLFFAELAEALARDETLRVVMSMRQEFIADVEPLMQDLHRPDRRVQRVRLERLRPEAAQEAVSGPAETRGVRFAPGVAEEICRQLSIIKARQFDGTVITKQGEFVEPVCLQVVCERLWRSLPSGTAEIRREHLELAAGESSGFDDFVGNALDAFYESVVTQVAESSETQAHGGYSKELIQLGCMKFVTAAGTRLMLLREARKTGRLPNWVVEQLEARHLVRAEERSGEKWYELAHDRLTEPVCKRHDPSLNELLYAADLISTVLGKMGEDRRQLRGYFALHPEILRECKRFLTQPGLLEDEAEFVLRASIANGEWMREWALRLKSDYPGALPGVLSEAVTHPSEVVRRHAAQLLGEGLVPEVEGELVRLALADPDAKVRETAAVSLARLDALESYTRLVQALDDPAQRERALEALCVVSSQNRSGEGGAEFETVAARMPARIRRKVEDRVDLRRFRDGLPSLFYVAIPAATVSALFTSGFKWMPATFNLAICQATPNALEGVFDGMFAAPIWGALIAVALTFHRVVLEHSRRRSASNMLMASLLGAIGGSLSGVFVTLMIVGVYEIQTLRVAGWISGTVQRWGPQFWHDLLITTHTGWAFPMTGTFLGVGVAASSQAVRTSPEWKRFLGEKHRLESTGEIRRAASRIFRMAAVRSWPVALAFLPATVIMIAMVSLGPGAPAWKWTLQGRCLTSIFECLAQVVGGVGVVAGMMFGDLIMRVGIRVPARTDRGITSQGTASPSPEVPDIAGEPVAPASLGLQASA